MGLRHLGREIALKALYQIDLSGDASMETLARFFENLPADERARHFAQILVKGVRAELPRLDEHLAAALEHWSIHRLSRIDHNILRIAAYELMHLDDVPARVTIDEAIELAKRYGDRDSPGFVNGVLDQVAERLKLKGKGDDQDVN